MSEEKKNNPEEQKETKFQKEKTELDKELKQTFPASDPPSRTRPGMIAQRRRKINNIIGVPTSSCRRN